MSESLSSPFADPRETNPFSDPSVTKIVGLGNHEATNYSPFSEDALARRETIVKSATSDLSQQQESLERAASRIESWEPNLQSRTVTQSERINNYPPFPACCPIKPCFKQYISLDIPTEYQRIVRVHYYFWIAYSILLLLNIGGCFAFFLVAQNKFVTGVSFGVSIGYFFLLIPCSYVCWYRPIYKAFRTDSSLNFFWYFFIFAAQTIVLIVDSLGFFFYGTVGWINGISCFEAGLIAMGIVMTVIAVFFDVLAIIGIVLLIRVNRHYRGSEASFLKARQELNQNIASNHVIQQGVTSIGISTARNAQWSTADNVFGNTTY